MRWLMFAALILCWPGDSAAPKGRLVLVGGGGTTPEIAKRVLEVAGGPDTRMLIVPQVSSDPEAGRESMEFWRSAGATDVACLDLTDHAEAVAAVEGAGLIWVPGGDQTRLMKSLAGTGVMEAIRKRYEAGATVGGTSAGASAVSSVMIEGDPAEETPDEATPLGEGLGLWAEAIVDQHFTSRRRHARLLRAVLDHPTRVGVGLDEKTGVIVSGRQFEVLGEAGVTVYDARKATLTRVKDRPPSASGVLTHLLRAGMKFDLDHGVTGE